METLKYLELDLKNKIAERSKIRSKVIFATALASTYTILLKWKKSNEKDIGLIAQDVESYYPEAVKVGKDGMKRIDYAKLLVPLLEIVKKQQKEIEQLKNSVSK